LVQWKRLEVVHDVRSPQDQAAAEKEGFISLDEYNARVARGDG
jgi:hypothetical protein